MSRLEYLERRVKQLESLTCSKLKHTLEKDTPITQIAYDYLFGWQAWRTIVELNQDVKIKYRPGQHPNPIEGYYEKGTELFMPKSYTGIKKKRD